MEKFSNETSFRQIAPQGLQRKNLGFSETEWFSPIPRTLTISQREPGRQRPCSIPYSYQLEKSATNKLKALYQQDNYCSYNSGCFYNFKIGLLSSGHNGNTSTTTHYS